jgi:kynurenine 3-monooxygenase
MRGRMIHREDGTTELQPYGQRSNEQIHSVSRADLNRLLIDAAEESEGVEIHFHQEAQRIDAAKGTLQVARPGEARRDIVRSPPVIAADGAGSAIRRSLAAASAVEVDESLLPHGYKELNLPPAAEGRFQLEPGALHIWPRGGFMLIALPNPGGDFTVTLFLPNDGDVSFAALDTPAKTEAFFAQHFPDIAARIPDLADTFLANPLGVLGTVRCRPWHAGGNVLLLGDAAHAIVPFHGQGMNLAFEDCVCLDRLFTRRRPDWQRLFAEFEALQRPNANAIADMALENYVEMRDKVREHRFVLQKELAFELERRLPGRFIPRYSMVMFHDDIPYAVAQRRGALQQELLDTLTRDADSLADIDLEAAAARVRERLPPLERDA